VYQASASALSFGIELLKRSRKIETCRADETDILPMILARVLGASLASTACRDRRPDRLRRSYRASSAWRDEGPRTKAAGADSDRAVRHRAAEHLAARDHEDAAGNRPAQLSSTSDCVSPTETPESVPETVFAPTRVNGPLSVVPEATPASTVGP